MGAQELNFGEWVIKLSATGYASFLGLVLFFWRPRFLPPEPRGDPVPLNLTVVIAARNEAENIGACLQSLIQETGISEIRVVDDHSTDQTEDVVRQVQVKDARIKLIRAPALPPGWFGKSHALEFGAKDISTKYLLFTDADVVFGPGIVAAAIRRMQTAQLDHLGGHFFVDCRSVAEEICAPVLLLSSGLALFGTASKLGAATGAFNLLRTEFYRDLGGHVPIRSEIVDDVALARHLKAGGGRSDFVALDDFVKVRLFVGFRGFVTSVSRSAVSFLKLGGLAVGCLTVCAMGLALLPFICLVLGILLTLAAPTTTAAVVAGSLALLPYFLGFLAIRLSRRFHNGRSLCQWGYPVALFVLAAAVFGAALAPVRRRSLVWRGRQYSLNQEQQLLPTASPVMVGPLIYGNRNEDN